MRYEFLENAMAQSRARPHARHPPGGLPATDDLGAREVAQARNVVGMEMGQDNRSDVVGGRAQSAQHRLRGLVRIELRTQDRTVKPQRRRTLPLRDLRPDAGIDQAQSASPEVDQAIPHRETDGLEPAAAPDKSGGDVDMSAVEQFHDATPRANVQASPSSNEILGVQPIARRIADRSRVWLKASNPAE